MSTSRNVQLDRLSRRDSNHYFRGWAGFSSVRTDVSSTGWLRDEPAYAASSSFSSMEASSTALVTSSTLSSDFSPSVAVPFPFGVALPEEDFLPPFSWASSASIFSISFLAFSMF